MLSIHFLIVFASIAVTLGKSVSLNVNISPVNGTEWNERIVGGEDAASGQFTHQVSLRAFAGSLLVHYCGAAILNNRWIITAASCTKRRLGNRFHIRAVVGSSLHPTADQIYKISLIISHESYNTPRYDNDIALLRTTRQIQFIGGQIGAVKLPKADLAEQGGQQVIVSGWGQLAVSKSEQLS